MKWNKLAGRGRWWCTIIRVSNSLCFTRRHIKAFMFKRMVTEAEKFVLQWSSFLFLSPLLVRLWKGPTSRQRSMKFAKILIILQQRAHKQVEKPKLTSSKDFLQVLSQINSQTECKQKLYYAPAKHTDHPGTIWHRLTCTLGLNTHTKWGTGVHGEVGGKLTKTGSRGVEPEHVTTQNVNKGTWRQNQSITKTHHVSHR